MSVQHGDAKDRSGKLLEWLVQIIEQSITPDAVVECDVKLPSLKSNSGTLRQCDVIIRQGIPPREIVTMVEVQDRGKAVEIGEFEGWLQKMEDIGANQLFCVSRKPFPLSIREKAAWNGHRVKLITLTQLSKARFLGIFSPQI